MADNAAQPAQTTDVLLTEGERDYSREPIPLTLVIGDLVAKVTIGGAWIKWAPAASDGSEDALGVVIMANGDLDSVAVVRHAQVKEEGIVWGAADAGQITAATDNLAAGGVIIRASA